MTEPTFHPTPPRRSGARIASLVGGAVAAAIAVGLLVLAGFALWGNAQKDEHGYLSTDTEAYATSTYALATENLDIESGEELDALVESAAYGKVRLTVDSRDDKPVFVGIARTSDVSDYLRGSAHAEVTDVDYSPFHADYATHAGDRPPAAPAEQGFWATSTHGPGQQTLTWDVEDGDWSIVVMNADGSRGVDANVSAGASVPFLGPLGWISLGTGLLLLITAAGLLYLGLRTPTGTAGRPLAATPVASAA